jgi:hypothetical protein
LSNTSEVVSALREHGASPAAAVRASEMADQLERRTRGSGRECCALLDLTTGAQVGPIVDGTQDRVPRDRLDSQLRAMQAGRRYLQLHTHPRSAAFSSHDGVLLTTWPEIHGLVVRGADGTTYLLSKTDAILSTERAEDVAQHWMRERDRLNVRFYLLRRRFGDDRAAWKLVADEIWRRIAPELGLRYDRVEST